jgi:phage gpG-like protein
MAGTISVTASGLAKVLRQVNAVVNLKKSLGEVNDAVGAVLVDRIRKRFLAEETADGDKWIPSKAGLRRRAAGGTGTLFASGTLWQSIQHARRSAVDGEILTDVPYAPQHQFGQKGNLKREFLAFNQSDADAGALIAAAIIERRISSA